MTAIDLGHIGRYHILRLLGEGGMGVVYEAVDEQIGRRVAIKRLHPEYARNSEIVQRFFNEARAVNLIAHPAIVQVSELATAPDGSAYLVMEYLAGETLSHRITSSGRKLSETATLRIISQLASALAAVHESGIVHRDLKPSNVMLIADPAMPDGERVKLLDFGIAKLGQGGKSEPLRTRTGVIMGTPTYMAPEQCLGAAQVDGKADVYSLGIMTFEMLAGQPPFIAEHDLVRLQMHLSTPAPLVRQHAPRVSHAVETLIDHMLRKEAASRPSMTAVLAETKRLLGEVNPPLRAISADASTVRSPFPMATPNPSTLRHSIGQMAAMKRQRRRLTASVFIGAALVLLGTLSYRLRRSSDAPTGMMTQNTQPQSLTAADNTVSVPTASAPPKEPDPAPVHITITTNPPNAQVINATTQEILGTTPWQATGAQSTATLPLILRKSGYQDLSVMTSYAHDATLQESLIAIVPKKTVSSPRSTQRAGTAVTQERPQAPAKPNQSPALRQNTYDPSKIAD